jgi:hypothetical protein
MTLSRWMITAVCGALLTTAATATPPTDHYERTEAAIDRYLGTLATVKAATEPRSLYALFDGAQHLQRLMMTLDGDDDKAWLERLSDARFAQLDDRLEGLRLHRGLDVHVEIDGEAFVALAAAHGTPVDQAFFTRYQGAYNDQALPVFLRFTDRVAPCVAFGEGLLEQQYRTWRAFAGQHPAPYAAFTQYWLDTIEDVVAQGTCTCTADTASVRDNLASFIDTFPDTPVRSDIEARITMLDETPYRRPVHCR